MANADRHSTNLLRRFLSGEVGPQEEAELERMASKDEALAEALNAYRQHPETDHDGSIKKLKSQLPRRQTRSLYRNLSAAAGLLVLLGTVALLWPEVSGDNAMSKESAPPLADSYTPIPEPKEEVSEQVEVKTAPVPIENTATPPPVDKQAEEQAPLKKRSKSSAPTEIKEQKEEPFIPVEENVAMSTEDEAAPTAIELEDYTVAPTAAAPMAARQSSAPTGFQSAGRRVISGYVTDEQNQPISSANITLPGQPIGEQTDSTGYFEFQTDQSVKVFEVNHPNFSNARIDLPRGENEVFINLESLVNETAEKPDEDWPFGGSKTTILPNAPKTAAAPDGGMQALREKMAAAKPAELPAGKVKVAFSVQANGSLTDFKFGKRSTSELISFVQNYLQQRSQWKLSGGDTPARMVLTFRFK